MRLTRSAHRSRWRGLAAGLGVSRHLMRSLLAMVLTVIWSASAMADPTGFSKAVRASLVFRDDSDPSQHYPHLLRVYIHLENVHYTDVTWVANPERGIEAELLDSRGRPAPHPPQATSVPSKPTAYRLPYGSRLDWLVTHGGISMVGDLQDTYALMLGGRGWLIPKVTVSTYSLRIRLRGVPWSSDESRSDAMLLLDIPPTRLEIANVQPGR